MRILYDSKQLHHKTPFGTLTPGEGCTMCIHIPATVAAVQVACCLQEQDGREYLRVPLERCERVGAYELFRGSFSLPECGLYFYRFHIASEDNSFYLYRQGDDTNMEAGDLWQLSCVSECYPVPDWATGAVVYQIFPDRFHKSGSCDLTGKLEPYILHDNWDEEVCWQPDSHGIVQNNDFFGGNFRGITEKMDYLASLGVDILYLNPISKSYSSHRYDTGDYKTPDPMLGTEAEFTAMCEAAHARSIRVVLDGVYSHTGANSLYFNKFGTFDSCGAANSTLSPYYSWYDFRHWPDRYACWWDFDTLPTVRKDDPGFVDYIITGEDSVVAHWLRAGADGFRLDVVDELPDEFVLLLRQRIRQIRPDALLIGEVWEDASNKIAYGRRRRYFVDGELDSVMNYPFRTALLHYLRGWDDGRRLKETVMTIAENYPAPVLLANMTLLGSHDTPRILTALVDDFDGDRQALAGRTLSHSQHNQAQQLLLTASFLQFMLPGSPSIYYGDEAGMEGHKDPFNRRTYPWGRENHQLQAHYRCLGRLRREQAALRRGDIRFFQAEGGRVGFSRSLDGQTLEVYVNQSEMPWEIPAGQVLYGRNLQVVAPTWLTLGHGGFCLLRRD